LQIIAQLAKENGLMFEGPSTDFKLTPHKAMKQDAQTDWEHVNERADAAGLVLFVRGDTLFAKEAAKAGKPVLTLTYRKDFSILQQFDCVFKTPENVAGKGVVKHRGRGRGGKRLEGATPEGRGQKHISLKTDLPEHVQAAATRRAQARRDLQREHAFTVSIRTLSPLPDVRPDVRNTIALLEMGKLFSAGPGSNGAGGYLADKVSHEFAPGHLTTSYDLYRDSAET
jgi:phage protein D